jgi:hypothetical protein
MKETLSIRDVQNVCSSVKKSEYKKRYSRTLNITVAYSIRNTIKINEEIIHKTISIAKECL